MKMSVRRIGLDSLARMGCLLGTVAAFLPRLACGLLALGLAVTLHRWLTSWQQASLGFNLPLVGEQSLTFDLVELLRLERLLSFLDTVTAASAVTLILVVLALAVVSGLLLAAIVTLVGLAYNGHIGHRGAVVELEPVRAGDHGGTRGHPPGPELLLPRYVPVTCPFSRQVDACLSAMVQ